jgi:hypothetical protein
MARLESSQAEEPHELLKNYRQGWQSQCRSGPRQELFSSITVIPTLNSCPQRVQV